MDYEIKNKILSIGIKFLAQGYNILVQLRILTIDLCINILSYQINICNQHLIHTTNITHNLCNCLATYCLCESKIQLRCSILIFWGYLRPL